MKKNESVVKTIFGDMNLIVNECNEEEIKTLIGEWSRNIVACEKLNQGSDMYIFVKYYDGATYSRSVKYEEGAFRNTGIKAVELHNGGDEYFTFGEYEVDELGLILA